MVRFALIKTVTYTYIRYFLGVILLALGWLNTRATHNLAGQITAEYLGNNTFEITLTTYTDPAPAGVDRCAASIEIWSVGPNPQLITILEDIPRANGAPQLNPPNDCPIANPLNGVPIYGSVKKNIYVSRYTFVGPGNYQLRYYDIARREDVVNMADPGSTAFYVETEINFLNPILGENNTPILLNDPLDEACAGQLWTHNPGGYDPDGDSLIYELRPSFQYEPLQGIDPSPVVGYVYPDDNGVYNNGPLTMDRFTGLMRWDVPTNFGTYNIAYVIKEYRNGRLLGYVVRDMAIFVKNCDNNPPVIETIEDTCVSAGTSLSIPFKAYDPDFLDSLYLELNNAGLGNNGPFSVPNSAQIEGLIIDQLLGNRAYVGLPTSTENNALTIDTITGTVSWETVCENIRTQPYQIDFFAHDDDSYITSPVQVRLTANKVVTINVIPPPPEELTATKNARRVTLDWLPTTCTNALGYNVYRKLNNAPYMQDTICCEMSPQDAGFELIGFVEGWENTSFLDSLNDVSFDNELCYVVTAIYPDAFNPSINALIESCATNQICVEVFNDKLYLTNVSVEATDTANGEMWIHWEKPDSIDSFFPRPFSLKLFRGNHTEAPTEEIVTLDFDNDSTGWRDNPLDTETQGYNYKVELYDALGLLVATDTIAKEGSSIYLETQGGNNAVTLSWSEYVPWRNDSYEIYRSEDGGVFTLLTTVNGTGANVHTYRDANLSPNIEYCYRVKSIGRYQNVPTITRELINYSQESCSFAVDIEPPCNPSLSLTGDCEELTHVLTITKSMGICANDADVITLYFASSPNANFTMIDQFPYSSFGEDTVLNFNFSANPGDFAGCYAISSTDTVGNTSEQSEPLCVDFCPDLEMGNVFSPNNDGINDYFTPVFYRDVQLVEFVVYDRWGRIMHRNISDIERLWEGTIDSNGKNAAEGVYYYYIRYEELGLTENVAREEKGWVTLLR